MSAIEIEGKSIDEAIENACREFNVPREKLKIEILSEGSGGFLGIGSQKARIRAGLLSLEEELEETLSEPEMKRTAEKEYREEKAPRVPENGGNRPEPLPAISPETSVAPRAKELLEGILTRLGLDFPVEMEESAEAVTFRIAGDGSGILIGKGGKTLDAIQYIINKAVGTTGQDRRRVILDTEEYRGRREDYLLTLATKLAEKVKKTHKPITVNYLSARDRRVIHLALKGDDALVTKSRGEGSYRKIVILPKRNGDSKEQSDR